MRRLLVGVMGHVDHGKTTLVRALTGMETDRLPEERSRGISIVLGFAHAIIGDMEIDFIDMPGHERFVRTMISGAGGVQAALLVVAADEGVKRQTVEHLEVAALLGVREAVVAVSKADRATPEQTASAAREAEACVVQAGLRATETIVVDGASGIGLEALRSALIALDAPAPLDRGLPTLPVDRAFSAAGHGRVVTGTLRNGRLAVGDVLQAAPAGDAVRVRALQVHGRVVAAAEPGQRVAVNLRGVGAPVERGATLARPGALAASERVTVTITAAPSGSGVKDGARLTLLLGTSDTPARVRLLDVDRLNPGETGFAQLIATSPIAAAARDMFVLRRASPPGTIAGGMILDPDAPRLRRHDADVRDHLHRLSAADPVAVLALALERAGPAGASLSRLAQLAGVAPERATELLKPLVPVSGRSDRLIAAGAFQAASARVLQELAAEPASLHRLQRETGLAAEAIEAVLDRLQASGRIRSDAGGVRLFDPAADRARDRDEAALTARLAEVLRQAGLNPPDLAGASASRETRRALERLVRDHVLVRAFDRVQKREILFHREAVEAARRTLRPRLSEPPGLLVSEAGAALNISRKFSVPLLEHLDAIQFTRRVGDRRVLGAGAAS